uniref:Uncharacterized protein n=1 Tax=Chlamydomonas leiostraca TaxID=1034604 RepID=A0A7S0RJ31_9CHLO|mmetsp:Transcript_23980/g.61060  ORF Transcript_23980/g.61060 Transcript_23980/m.61060 type:complete len:555 (+) Transcript_23980:120-1784(+)|eukprot:CAMPEP_0202858962 /NCGR_PEP_ID=MMETSP1391-20130828/1275_1 /ASSEMBLY_ACC=CAM_ASM_000867 /TAXON_ID=1034604 /ORGANISM="Chlamydomonas leiostraca, Strain SAG 11-49" /LENGTH=554 /DNA_ID=CAMNT_0049537949 /DNA_START=116 /DNA_END=1780 /DNA_ORIENTATION=+
MINLNADALHELESLLLHGDFDQTAEKSAELLSSCASTVFHSAPLALRLLYVTLQAHWFSGRQQQCLELINAKLGGLNKLPTQVFILWQLLQLDEGQGLQCRREVESFLEELVSLHRVQGLQQVQAASHQIRIFSDGQLDVAAGPSQKDLLGAAMAIAAAGKPGGRQGGTIGEFLALQRATSAAIKGAARKGSGHDAADYFDAVGASHASSYYSLSGQEEGLATGEQAAALLRAAEAAAAAEAERVRLSLDAALGPGSLQHLEANGALSAASEGPDGAPSSLSAAAAATAAEMVAASSARHPMDHHVHAGPVHVYDYLHDGGEHQHIVALSRFYLVDLLCQELHDHDAAEAFLFSEQALLLLSEEDRETLRTEVAAAELASAAAAAAGGSARGSRQALDSEFCTMMGELNDDSPDWSKVDQSKATGGLTAAGGKLAASRSSEIAAASGGGAGTSGTGAGSSWSSWWQDTVGWVTGSGGRDGNSGSGNGHSVAKDVAVTVAAAVVLYAVYHERNNIKKAVKKRTSSVVGLMSELSRMAFSLTPSPATSGYRPAMR